VRTELEIDSHGVPLAAWRYRADHDRWARPAGRPVVLMAHGLGGTRDTGLAPFAERFAAAGADVVVFDYRGFGDSGVAPGRPRQSVDHRRHREDYVSALTHVRGMAGVDPDRVVLWGSSYSGGHVIAVAARDPRVAGVISQGAAMDGRRAVLKIVEYAGPGQLARVAWEGLRGLVSPRRTVPVVGPPGSRAVITSPDALPGYTAIAGPTWRNEMLARDIDLLALNNPVLLARRVTAPTLLVVATRDAIAPASAVEEVGRRVRGPVRVERLDVGHFDLYVGEAFETSATAQVEFLGAVVGR